MVEKIGLGGYWTDGKELKCRLIPEKKIANYLSVTRRICISIFVLLCFIWAFKNPTWALQFNLRTETFVNTICKFEDKNTVTSSTDGIFSTGIMKMFFLQDFLFQLFFINKGSQLCMIFIFLYPVPKIWYSVDHCFKEDWCLSMYKTVLLRWSTVIWPKNASVIYCRCCQDHQRFFSTLTSEVAFTTYTIIIFFLYIVMI